MKNNQYQYTKSLLALVVLGLINGCASTNITDTKDPWVGWNHSMQSFNDRLDHYVIKPVAQGYNSVMPEFAHKGVTNFFSNLDDIDVIANDALQGKMTQSGQDSARLLVNTTVGVAGFVDVASMIDLQKHNEDFDQTLGFWGVPTGPYLVLPLFGPSSPRGFFGLIGDAALNPISYTGIYFGTTSSTSYIVSTSLGVLRAVNTRANNLGLEKLANDISSDRYTLFRDAYLARRNFLVHDGNVPEEDVLKFDEKDSKSLGPLSPN